MSVSDSVTSYNTSHLLLSVLLLKELPSSFVVLLTVAAIEESDIFDGALDWAVGHVFFDMLEPPVFNT